MKETTETTGTTTGTTAWGSCQGTEVDRRNNRRVRLWTLVWMGSWLAVVAAVSFELIPQGPLAVTLTVLTALPGVVALAAYRRYLMEADELRRKIELDALAWAYGIGVVVGLGYWLLERAHPAVEADLMWVVTLMLFTQGIATWIGCRRYS